MSSPIVEGLLKPLANKIVESLNDSNTRLYRGVTLTAWEEAGRRIGDLDKETTERYYLMNEILSSVLLLAASQILTQEEGV